MGFEYDIYNTLDKIETIEEWIILKQLAIMDKDKEYFKFVFGDPIDFNILFSDLFVGGFSNTQFFGPFGVIIGKKSISIDNEMESDDSKESLSNFEDMVVDMDIDIDIDLQLTKNDVKTVNNTSINLYSNYNEQIQSKYQQWLKVDEKDRILLPSNFASWPIYTSPKSKEKHDHILARRKYQKTFIKKASYITSQLNSD